MKWSWNVLVSVQYHNLKDNVMSFPCLRKYWNSKTAICTLSCLIRFLVNYDSILKLMLEGEIKNSMKPNEYKASRLKLAKFEAAIEAHWCIQTQRRLQDFGSGNTLWSWPRRGPSRSPRIPENFRMFSKDFFENGKNVLF